MKRQAKLLCVLALVIAVLLGGISWAWAATSSGSATKPAQSSKPPGIEAAQTLSTITGVAISPLMGVGAVGCYYWWKAPENKRPGLPWFAQPWFWVPALLLVAVVGVKDILGTASPTALKKPFDVAEAIENKASALLAAGAFIPLIISIFPEAVGDGSWAPSHSGFAAIGLGTIGNALLVPFALAIFAVVWMASHAINMLILLSPFTTVDAALKSLRLGLLVLVTSTSFINAYLGAFVSVLVIVFCYLIAGWSFRLSVFGTVYIWDFITLRRRRSQPGAEHNRCFAARKIRDVPVRTYGRLSVEPQGGFRFTYRPLLVLPPRTLTLPGDQYVIGRGLFCPELDRVAEGKTTALFIFPPRYSTHEDALARACGLKEVRDVGVLKGVKAAWKWCKGLFRGSADAPPTPVAATPA